MCVIYSLVTTIQSEGNTLSRFLVCLLLTRVEIKACKYRSSINQLPYENLKYNSVHGRS